MAKAKQPIEKDPRGPISEEQVLEVLDHWDLLVKDINYVADDDPDNIPYVVIDHWSYLNMEAHIFTVADMALWIPELLPSKDVVVYYPLRHPWDRLTRLRTDAWDMLVYHLDVVMESVWESRRVYGAPSEKWAHHEREEDGYFEIDEDQPVPIDRILRCVDPSIKGPILDLNRSGFATVSSCSGLRKDHEGKSPFGTFVFYDDEYYLDVSAHLFTLGEAAGWDTTFGAHGFHVVHDAREYEDSAIEKAWHMLATKALEFGEYLENYRDLVDTRRGNLYYDFRKQRGLFSIKDLLDSILEIEERYEFE